MTIRAPSSGRHVEIVLQGDLLKIAYQRIPFEALKQGIIAGAQHAPDRYTAPAFYGEKEHSGTSDSYLMQHLREVMIDHDNGIFAGSNDYVRSIGGEPPASLESFIERHKEAFL